MTYIITSDVGDEATIDNFHAARLAARTLLEDNDDATRADVQLGNRHVGHADRDPRTGGICWHTDTTTRRLATLGGLDRDTLRDMEDAHAQGMHDDLAREFCPMCSGRTR